MAEQGVRIKRFTVIQRLWHFGLGCSAATKTPCGSTGFPA
jgi:hypothetical protein